MRRKTFLLGAFGLGVGLVTPAMAYDLDAQHQRWLEVRKMLWGARPIAEDGQTLISLEAPTRAHDGAVVPIAIRTPLVQTPARYIRKMWLVIDANPSPVGAVFNFTPESGRAEIETRVRIEEYTHMRAVAELSDGSLVMSTRYVKAAGGCSAPAGKDLEQAMASLGRMRLKVEEAAAAGKPALVQLMVSHPNVSGMGIDQLTRLTPPPYFVRSVAVSYAGKPVMSAEVDFTISENPSFRFYVLPSAAGELKAEVLDTRDRRFEQTLQLGAPAAG